VAPLEEGEVYYHQLLGLEVVTLGGEVVGCVREVYETEPAHLLEVKGPERSHLIPFVKRIVKQVDLAAGRLLIEPPPGLLEI
jgi:16S rRNA processing protein RimM